VSVSIKPLEDRIVVRTLDAEQTTASGLVIPDTAKEKPQEGEVLAIGPGRIDDNGNRVPLDVTVGDKVIYSKYGGTEVKFGGVGVPDPLRSRRPRDHREVAARPFGGRGTDGRRPEPRWLGAPSVVRGGCRQAQLAFGRPDARIELRSSSEMPPHTPYGSRTERACVRHCWSTGQP